MHSHLRVTVDRNAQHTLEVDVHRRRHIEACGLLLGNVDDQGNWSITQTVPLRNTFSSPVYFEFDPQELVEAELQYADSIIGVYHSHPTGFARASDTDRENMHRVNIEQAIPWVWLIICGPFCSSNDHDTLLNTQKILAYHHFREEGLQQLAVVSAHETQNTL
jgi:proteasome lid subunit RPN8/RPN11